MERYDYHHLNQWSNLILSIVGHPHIGPDMLQCAIHGIAHEVVLPKITKSTQGSRPDVCKYT